MEVKRDGKNQRIESNVLGCTDHDRHRGGTTEIRAHCAQRATGLLTKSRLRWTDTGNGLLVVSTRQAGRAEKCKATVKKNQRRMPANFSSGWMSG